MLSSARAWTVVGLLALSACAAESEGDGERFIVFPPESKTIDLAETDLTLPLESPFEIDSVRERVSEGQVFENVYSFHQVRGYIRTARVVFGHYSSNTSKELRSFRAFKDYAGALSLPPGGELELGKMGRFVDDDRGTLGYYALASSEPYHNNCFIARVGFLLVDYASVEREPDSVDAIVSVLLCGRLPPEAELRAFVENLRAVENREAYRRALSKRAVGTI